MSHEPANRNDEPKDKPLGFIDSVWKQLTPRERLRRSRAMRSRLVNPQAVHDRKLFPKP